MKMKRMVKLDTSPSVQLIFALGNPFEYIASKYITGQRARLDKSKMEDHCRKVVTELITSLYEEYEIDFSSISSYKSKEQIEKRKCCIY